MLEITRSQSVLHTRKETLMSYFIRHIVVDGNRPGTTSLTAGNDDAAVQEAAQVFGLDAPFLIFELHALGDIEKRDRLVGAFHPDHGLYAVAYDVRPWFDSLSLQAKETLLESPGRILDEYEKLAARSQHIPLATEAQIVEPEDRIDPSLGAVHLEDADQAVIAAHAVLG